MVYHIPNITLMIEMDGRKFIIIAMPQENKLLLQLIWLLKISFISILGNVTIRMVSKRYEP